MNFNKLNSAANVKNIEWLVFFRIAVSSFCIIHYFSIYADISKIFFDTAVLKPDIIDASFDRFSPTLIDLQKFIRSHLFNISYNNFVILAFVIYITFLFFLLIGFMTRISALISLLFQLLIYKSIYQYLYGVDYFVTVALFYCVIFPISSFSIDKLLFKSKPVNRMSEKWSLIILQTHLCVLYFFSGFDKALGKNWYNGEALWKASTSHNYNGVFEFANLHLPTWIIVISGIASFSIEILYPIFININATRKIWLLLTILLHLNIILFMGLYFFGVFMLILNLTAYYFPFQIVKNENYVKKL